MPFDPNQPFEVIDAPDTVAPAPRAVPAFDPKKKFKAFNTPLVEDGRAAALSVYPDLQIGSNFRPKDHPLSKKYSNSFHSGTKGAIDAAAIPGMTFDQYVQGYKDAGYDVIEAIDEYKNPSPWATGPHWHVVLGKAPEPASKTSQEASQAAAPVQATPPKPIDQDVSVGLRREDSGTLAAGTTGLTGQEQEQQNWVESFIAKNSKTSPFNEVAAAIEKRYPGFTKVPGNFAAVRWYYNSRKAGQKVPMNWVAPKREDTGENPDIVVEGRQKAPYETELTYLADRYKQAAQTGFGGVVARAGQQMLNPDLTPEQIAEAQRAVREELWAKIANNPTDETLGGQLAGFGADILGWAGPEYFLPGAIGESALSRGIYAAASNAGADAVYQGADIDAGVQDEFSLTRGLVSTVGGVAFQGVMEGLGKLLQNRVKPTGTEPGVEADPQGNTIEILPDRLDDGDGKMYQEFRMRDAEGNILSDGRVYDSGHIKYWGDTEPSIPDVMQAKKNAPRLDRLEPVEPQGIPRGEDLSQKPIDPELEKMLDEEFQKASQELGTPEELVNYKDPTLTQEVNILTTPELEQRIALAQAGKTGEKDNRPYYRTKAYGDQKIAELTSGWKNPPKINVVDKFDELPEVQQLQILRDTDGRPEDVKAFVDADGTVHAIMDHLEGPEDVTALTYHEALGHYGLSLQFGKTLDTFLDRAYKTNPDLREAADAWFLEGGQVPEGVDPRLRATEEVLAERSETGPFDATAWDRIKNIVKAFARKAGMKDLAYSDREIKTILAMAHSKVINGGRNAQVSADGNRYIRVVTHVSPHDFKNIDKENPHGKFDHSFMGTGEGAQVRGWGTYLGERTRDYYLEAFRNKLKSSRSVLIGDTPLREFSVELFPEESINPDGPTFQKALSDVSGELQHYFRNWPEEELKNIPEKLLAISKRLEDESIDYVKGYNELHKKASESLAKNTPEGSREAMTFNRLMRELQDKADVAFFKEIIYKNIAKSTNKLKVTEIQPATYEVHISPEQESQMLHLDDNLLNQPEKVKEGLKKLGITIDDSETVAKARSDFDEAQNRLDTSLEEYSKYLDSLASKYGLVDNNSEADFIQKVINETERDEYTKKFNAYLDAYNNLTQARNAYSAVWGFGPEIRTGEDVYSLLHARLGSAKEASLALRDAGIIGNKYEDGFSRNKNGEKTYNFVIFDENEAKIINKYMRKKRPTKAEKAEEASQKAKDLAGNINLDNFDLSGGAEAVMRLVGKEIPKTKITMEETRAAAEAMGVSFKDVRDYAHENGAARLLAMRQVLARSAERTMRVAQAIGDGDNSDLNLALFARYMAMHRSLQESVSKSIGNAGRTLRAMREVAKANDVNIETLRMMGKRMDMEHLGDRANLEATAKLLLEHKDNPAAQTKVAKDMYSPFWEDYLISFRYNMMLYNLGTHAVNLIGNTGSTYMDLIDRGFASIIGQMKRLFGSKDRTSAREVYARQMGLLQALANSKTYAEAGQSFAQGRPTHQVSKVEIGSNLFSNKVGPAGIALEVPSRALAMSDSFSRSMIEQAALNGLAHRTALSEGFTGDAYKTRVAGLIESPTTGMKAKMANEAAILQLVDEPSWMGQMLERLKQHPRKNQYGHRMARFALHMVAPFSRVSDRLFWAAVRRTPIVGFLDKVNQADFAAGGAQRDLVFGRMMTGALLVGYLVQKYNDGELSGSGPSDFRARGAKVAEGWQPNSIKFGDTWYSLRGSDQITPLVNMVAEFGDTIKDKDFQSEDEVVKAMSLIGAAANGMHQNTFLNQLSQLFGTFGKTGLAETNRENYVANMVSSFLPSGVRHSAELADGQQRDSSGTGTMGAKVQGAIERSLPGLREDLPQKYDPYGRPMVSNKNLLTIGQNVTEDKTMVVQEIKRLSELNDGKPIVTPVARSDLKKAYGTSDVPAQIVQEYQRVSGEYIFQSLQENMATPEWQSMTDEEKIKLSKKIVEQMRKYAREDLFGGDVVGN